MAEPRALGDQPALVARSEGGVCNLLAGDAWTIDRAGERERDIATAIADLEPGAPVEIDLSGVARLDTSGAWLVHRVASRLKDEGHEVRFRDLTDNQRILLEEVSENEPGAVPETPEPSFPVRLATDAGLTVIHAGRDLTDLLALLGQITLIGGRLLRQPARMRYTSFLHHLEHMGLRAVPIIALISVLIGGIIEQQGVYQLRGFGAEIYSVDLAGILILRELGVLLTSVMVAGRTGSAITAEIGSMKMREEIDAMRTLALDPAEVLILPRLVALIIALPLLTFLSDIACLFGAGLVAWTYIDLPPATFVTHLRGAIDLNTFLVGMIKAPFMALAIGFIACREGLAVEGSAESLGAQTTAAVVKSIFIVIVLDGVFAMFFSTLGI